MHRAQLIVTASILAACAAPTEVEEGEESVTEAVSGVTVDGGAGDLRVTGSSTATGAELRWRMTWSDERPTLTQAQEGGVWVIQTDCPLQLVCLVDLDLTVPAAADAVLAVGSGDSVVRGLSGRVDLSAGSGDMLLDALAGEAHVDIGSGDLTGTALVAPLHVLVGSGDLDLVFDAPAEVDLAAGSGDIGLTVPPGAYAVSVETGSGDVSVSGIEDTADGVELIVETGSGDVTIGATR
jgi:hypothetical protein